MARYFVASLPPAYQQAEVCCIKQYFADHYHNRQVFKSLPHIILQSAVEWPQPVPHADASADFIPIELVNNGLTDFLDSQAPIQLLTMSQKVSLANRITRPLSALSYYS